MKKLFLLPFLLVSLLTTAVAQNPIETVPQTSAPDASELISSGNWIVGGSVGSLALNFNTGTFQIDVNPSAAYFISDRAAIGLQTILGLTVYDAETNVNATYRYGITPMIRYYLPEGSRPSGRWFGEALIGFAGSSLVNSESDENFSFLFGVNAGYAHFVAQHVALEGKLGYVGTEADLSNSGLGVSLGFQIYLPGKRR